MKEIRQRKIKDFELFYDNCESVFTNLRNEDKRAEKFENEYILSICPGSRAGGNEKRIIEVFWGARPYEYITKGNTWKSLVEKGATLFFYRNDTGDISISIYPAKTEYIEPIESHIVLHEWIDPKKLNNPKFVKSLWNDFIDYMECTSLDGSPSIFQKLKIYYYRQFKHLVIDKKWQPTKISEFIKEIIKWVLTVGLSGTIIYYVSQKTQPKTTETEIQLIKLNEKLNLLNNQVEYLNKRIDNTEQTTKKDTTKK